MRRVISLWLPRLTTDRLRRSSRGRRRPTPPTDAPLAAFVQTGGRAIIVAVDDAADARGIAPGMGLADARALVPGLAALPADPAGDTRALARLADWAERYTPSVAPDGGDGLVLDVTGCAHLFGGEAAMLADLLGRVRRLGLAARGALADTPGAAAAIARFAPQDDGGIVAPPGGAGPLLDPLPIAALRLAPDTAEGLARVGLRRIADLRRLERESGRAALATRFGPRVWRRLDQALGRAEEAIAPRRPAMPHRVRLAFAEPIATAEDIARAARLLLDRLALRLETADLGARRIAAAFFRADGQVRRLEIGTAAPSRDPKHLFGLLAEKLEQVEPGFGIDLAELSAPQTEPLHAAQIDLPAAPATAAAGIGLGELIDRLENRLGAERVGRQAPRESHAPERAVRAMAALAPPSAARWSLPPRPLRLFARPEPVDAIAGADASPSLFRWRAHLHRVCVAEGPERLAAEWWLADATRATRDYWRVEDEDGRRFWLYRVTEVGGQKPEEKGSWFLHGEFA
jgi:protein ImuB